MIVFLSLLSVYSLTAVEQIAQSEAMFTEQRSELSYTHFPISLHCNRIYGRNSSLDAEQVSTSEYE